MKSRNPIKCECTYRDADGENSSISASISVVAFEQKNLSLDPLVVHGVEDGHADPEPDVECGQ